MSQDEESRYWRRLFYAAKDANEEWKFRHTVMSVIAVMSILFNAYLICR